MTSLPHSNRMISFDTISDVEAWASQHGGVEAVNDALAKGAFGANPHTIRTAIRYVEREELKIAERLNREAGRTRATSAAEQFARAAQQSARDAYISRWIAIVCAVIALGAVLFLFRSG